MFDSIVLSMFLYFPEDKAEYFPAAISFMIFLAGAIITMRFIVFKSRKEEKEAKKLEKKIFQNQYKDS